MRTPERDRRTPNNARRIAATASLAAAAIVGASAIGATAGAAPANASESTTATAVTPVAKLVANHSSVTAGKPVTFTVTDKTANGKAIAAATAGFYVHTVNGWKKFGTKTLSAEGTTTFTFHPNYDHAYKVDLSAVTTGGTLYNAVNTPSITVKAKSADIGPAIVAAAAKLKGKPYRFGAAGPNAFDCSGLVEYVFHKFGISLPHNAEAQKSYGTKVSKADAKPGDLVFVLSGSHAYHVAIYAGDGMWWEAPHSGADVRHVKMWSTHIEFRHVR